MIDKVLPNVNWDKTWEATLETIFMTGVSVLATFILGIILGVLLFLTSRGNLWDNKVIYWITAAFVNVFRSIPFIILIVLLIPFTKVIMGTIIGEKAALPALIIGAAPFYARLVEIGLREIDKGVIEAVKSMGAKTSTIIFKLLLPESMPDRKSVV